MSDDPVREAAVALANLVDLREGDFEQAREIIQSAVADDLAHQEALTIVNDALARLLDKLQDFKFAQAVEILHGPPRRQKTVPSKRKKPNKNHPWRPRLTKRDLTE